MRRSSFARPEVLLPMTAVAVTVCAFALVPLWPDVAVTNTTFLPAAKTFELAVFGWTGPMVVPEVTPPFVPASSPLLFGTFEPSTTVGFSSMSTLSTAPVVAATWAVFG